MPDRRLVVGAAIVGVLLSSVVGGVALAGRSQSVVEPGAGEGVAVESTGRPPSAAPTSTAPRQGLGCIRGGTTREEVRAIMGEPDSVAFGDWIYGRSSLTFGYGVVLDYTNTGGDLVICP
jgi:hypothetical protein